MILNYREDPNIKTSTISIVAKPNDKKVSKILNIIESTDDRILLDKDSKFHLMEIDKIYYIEVVENTVFVYTKDEIYESDLRLYEILQILPNNFIRISKSIVVNLFYVKVIVPMGNSKLMLELDNIERVLVNRGYIKAFKERIKMR